MKTKDDGDIEEELVTPKILTSKLTLEKEKVIEVHDVYIYGPIERPEAYQELSKALLKADPEKEYFRFRLSSNGGSCHGVVTLINNIRQCQTLVEMHVDGPCYSAATDLALSGTSLIMHPNTLLMFHNYSGGAIGKGGELVKMVKEEDDWNRKTMKHLYSPFLTDAEIELLFKDQDVWIHSYHKDIKQRIKRHFERSK